MKKTLIILTAVCLAALASVPAFAGTDATFSTGVTRLSGYLIGSGGLLVMLIAIIAAIVAGSAGNIKMALTALGVGLIASIGPSIATSLFTATLVLA